MRGLWPHSHPGVESRPFGSGTRERHVPMNINVWKAVASGLFWYGNATTYADERLYGE